MLGFEQQVLRGDPPLFQPQVWLSVRAQLWAASLRAILLSFLGKFASDLVLLFRQQVLRGDLAQLFRQQAWPSVLARLFGSKFCEAILLRFLAA